MNKFIKLLRIPGYLFFCGILYISVMVFFVGVAHGDYFTAVKTLVAAGISLFLAERSLRL